MEAAMTNKTLRRKRFVLDVGIIALALMLVPCLAFGGSPPAEGGVLPDIAIPMPQSATDRGYLGLQGEAPFKIPQVKAQVVIIEIFSMYCPFCQAEAPEMNRMYAMIEENPNLKEKIKVIGIGAGNSAFEVSVFKKKYNVPFPLIADEDFTFHKCFGEVRTPYFLGVRINSDGTHKVFYSKAGEFKGAEQFLKLMLEKSGLKEGGVK
jgi:peroxiredoxin